VRPDENPYKWDEHRPQHPVRRQDLLTKVGERILKGESGYLIGCRGMGKSVFLRQLEEELRRPGNTLFFFPTPGVSETIPAAIQAIATKMVESSRARGAPEGLLDALQDYSARGMLRELFVTYLDETPADVERLLLIYDELDRYASFGRSFFTELEDIRKNSDGRLVIFAAGGIGLVALDTLLGSSFFSRLTPEILEPFDRHGLARLAEPFARRGAALSLDVLETLRLASGGNLGLATFGLQRLWSLASPSPGDVAEIFDDFRDKHGGFLKAIREPIFDEAVSDAPARVWRKLQATGGQVTRQRLRELIRGTKGAQRVDDRWVFNMLRSTGLIRCSDDAYRRATIEVELIPSILTFDIPGESTTKGSIREQLVADLVHALTGIQRMSPDFFRSDEKNKKQIVPEAVFAAILGLVLQERGWKVEREAQSAAGRTDVKAQHVDFGESWVVIEVKIWNRNDYADIHGQVTGYWSQGVEALATVMVTDVQKQAWPDDYETTCLTKQVPAHERKDSPRALAGHFVASTDGIPVKEVDHFLLRLAKRD
jgi:hypothetical protein